MLALASVRTSLPAAAIIAAVSLATAAQANVSDPALTIRAQAGAAVDVFTFPLALFGPGGEVGSLQYTLPSPLTLPNTGAVVTQLNMSYVPENAIPAQENLISLGFTVVTASGPTTNFIFSSGEFTLKGLPAFFGRGSANVSVASNDFMGVTYTGLNGGGGFLTQFNGGFGPDPIYAPLGSHFHTFGPAALTHPFGTSGGEGLDYTFLGGPHTSMSSQWRFDLTGNAQASVTSVFFSSNVIPAPGAAALLAVGGLVAFRRRR